MKIKKILSFIIVLLAIFNIVYANNMVDQGREIIILTKKIDQIEHVNKKFQLRVAERGSFTKIQQMIAEAGFEEATAIVSIQEPSNVALKQ